MLKGRVEEGALVVGGVGTASVVAIGFVDGILAVGPTVDLIVGVILGPTVSSNVGKVVGLAVG